MLFETIMTKHNSNNPHMLENRCRYNCNIWNVFSPSILSVRTRKTHTVSSMCVFETASIKYFCFQCSTLILLFNFSRFYGKFKFTGYCGGFWQLCWLLGLQHSSTSAEVGCTGPVRCKIVCVKIMHKLQYHAFHSSTSKWKKIAVHLSRHLMIFSTSYYLIWKKLDSWTLVSKLVSDDLLEVWRASFQVFLYSLDTSGILSRNLNLPNWFTFRESARYSMVQNNQLLCWCSLLIPCLGGSSQYMVKL